MSIRYKVYFYFWNLWIDLIYNRIFGDVLGIEVLYILSISNIIDLYF